MNRCSFVWCSVLLSLGCWVSHARAQDGEVVGEIKQTDATINLDGKGDDPAWASANAYSDFFDTDRGAPDGPADSSATWRGLWDETNLYLLIEVTDDEFDDDSGDWNDDSIELYIDGQMLGQLEGVTSYSSGADPIYQLTVLAGETDVSNGINHTGWPDYDVGEGFIPLDGGAILSPDNNYSLEVALPWDSIEETPDAIMARGGFGLGVAINDDDDGGDRDSQIMWATEYAELWNDATGFPIVNLAAGASSLQAGDADMDFDFDQFDLIKVQIAAKYMTGQPATWGEGDWNGAPGGSPGNPPAGDGQFNQLDIIAALGPGHYMTGPYAAIAPGGGSGDEQTSIVYNPKTGELGVDAPASTELTSINIDSAAGIFTGDPAQNLGGSFDNDADNNIFKATFGGSFGTLSFGTVAQAGLSEQFVLGDLTVVGSLAGGGDLGNVDLIYVPEPSTLVLLALGLFLGVVWRRRS